MKKPINEKVKVNMSFDSEGYQRIEFASYSTDKVTTEDFINFCIDTLTDLKNNTDHTVRRKREWYQYWKRIVQST
jgi:hypothetical protein